jgi:hypothetical protein
LRNSSKSRWVKAMSELEVSPAILYLVSKLQASNGRQ